ncbi:MAG: YgiQ family radical SAM protein [Clostridiales bacterium]|nr:YgiQ family radical SAM protein [Clostridiales bacterium]
MKEHLTTEYTFLPVSRKDMEKYQIEQLDFVYVTGDAYVDHPSFGTAIISRVLQAHGYRVGIIPQPDYRDADSIGVLGEPRLGFLVSAGNMDSMVNHYTVAKKRRKMDAYTPGGEMGKRPDRAVTVYCNLIRQKYKKKPIIAGGIEASLRRLAHYDYWSDSLRRSILLESGADLISYGMGERSVVEIADALDAGMDIRDLTYIPGTVCKVRSLDQVSDYTRLPDYETILADKSRYAESFYIQYCNTDPFSGKRLVEAYSKNCFVVQNPAAEPLSREEMDQVYDLPYMRTWHPMYDQAGGIPALSEVKFSLVSCRGCFGGCSFCALTFHQGRIVQSRSHASLLKEAEKMTEDPEFKGYIHDVGGPTADFRAPACEKQMTKGVCPRKQCLFPEPCQNLKADHRDYIALLQKLRALPRVKKVFIRSGIRFDYVLADKDSPFLEELCRYHVSGQLKVAPEHVSDQVLACLGKPRHAVYEEFSRQYRQMNERLGLKQYLVPYLMSSHPGSTMKEAVKLAEYCWDLGYMPEQVQDFYPTPSTISTCMYYTGLDPRTMRPVYVPRSPHEKEMQRALIQYRNPGNRTLVEEALKLAGRTDLIGFGPKCLLRPSKPGGSSKTGKTGKGSGAENGQKKKKTIRNVHRKKQER